MSYNISSESFNNPVLSELLEKLTSFFDSIGSEFYVIGATARDIIISGIHNQPPRRKTMDLDIAIAIPDWNKFQEISDALEKVDGFHKSMEQTQRFWYRKYFMLDIVPFGEIARADHTIYWPPEETQAMSVIGFTEVAKHTLEIIIDNRYSVNIATLPGIFLLKLAAWHDRHLTTNKDADDMAFIMINYLEINTERAATAHYDLYEVEAFTTFTAGAALLGRDMKTILKATPEILDEFIGMLRTEVNREDDSILINQMLEMHASLKYEEVYDALLSVVNELINS